MINVHHFADHIIQFLDQHQHFGINIHISHEREVLLDTGGGLKHAAWFFDGGHPFLVHNVDILTDLDLGGLYQAHCHSSGFRYFSCEARPGRDIFFRS